MMLVVWRWPQTLWLTLAISVMTITIMMMTMTLTLLKILTVMMTPNSHCGNRKTFEKWGVLNKGGIIMIKMVLMLWGSAWSGYLMPIYSEAYILKAEKFTESAFQAQKKSAEKVRKSRHKVFATKLRKSIKSLKMHYLKAKCNKNWHQEHDNQRFGAFLQDFSTLLDLYL